MEIGAPANLRSHGTTLLRRLLGLVAVSAPASNLMRNHLQTAKKAGEKSEQPGFRTSNGGALSMAVLFPCLRL